jgi:hypothetical protein
MPCRHGRGRIYSPKPALHSTVWRLFVCVFRTARPPGGASCIGAADFRDALAHSAAAGIPAQSSRLGVTDCHREHAGRAIPHRCRCRDLRPVSATRLVGKRFLGEARLPVLSPELMRECPLRTPADLERHTLLHAATLREAWPRWLAAANVPDLKPARDQVSGNLAEREFPTYLSANPS